MIMLLFFSVIGGLFYSLFLKSPETTNPTVTISSPPFRKKEAAGMHGR